MKKCGPRTYILEEDQHLENIRKIIKRDFFGSGDQQDAIGLSLNNYITNFKSDENKFFSEMVHSNQEDWKKEHWWFGKQDQLLMINAPPSKPYHNLLEGAKANGVALHSIKQEAHNSFYFNKNTDFGSYNNKEHNQAKKIHYENCRLDDSARQLSTKPQQQYVRYGKNEVSSKPLLKENRTEIQENLGGGKRKIVDGNDSQTQQAPIMTWGEIEATPLRLSGPQFKMQESSARDEILNQITKKLKNSKKAHTQQKSDLYLKILGSMTPGYKSSFRKESSVRHVDKSNQSQILEGLLDIGNK